MLPPLNLLNLINLVNLKVYRMVHRNIIIVYCMSTACSQKSTQHNITIENPLCVYYCPICGLDYIFIYVLRK